jgi:hypothetical protein
VCCSRCWRHCRLDRGELEHGLLAKAAHDVVPRLDQIHLDYSVLFFNLAVSIACGIIFGLAPAWRFSKPDLQET